MHDIASNDFHDVQEAFYILSDPELKIMYDKELEAYNASGDFNNYTIHDSKLANTISTLQCNLEKSTGKTSGGSSKIGKGCMWAVVVVIILLLQMCVTAIMKQQSRNAVKSRYSYVVPHKQQLISHVYKLL